MNPPDKLIFVSGRGFVRQSELDLSNKDKEMGRDSNIVDMLASMQAELNTAWTDKQRALDLMNSFRLDLYPESVPQSHDSKGHVKEYIFEMLTRDDEGIVRAELFIKHTRDLCAMVSNLVEDYRSKNSIKIKRTKENADAMDLVDKLRKSPKTGQKKGPEKYTPEQKIIRNLRTGAITKNMSQTDICNVICAMNPKLTPEFVRTEIERQIAKETAAKSGKEVPKPSAAL